MSVRLHRIYENMKKRCYNPNHNRAKYYYFKGIRVCDEWLNDYETFKKWSFENGYEENLSIDRIDYNKNYCPENCRWVNAKVQGANKTNTRKINYHGKEYTFKELSKITGLSLRCLDTRYRRGWTIEDIFNVPKLEKRIHNKEGKFIKRK